MKKIIAVSVVLSMFLQIMVFSCAAVSAREEKTTGIEVESEGIEVYEYARGSYKPDYYEDEEGNELQTPSYFQYGSPEPEEIPIKAKFSDESVYEGRLSDLIESLGCEYTVSSDQSYEKQWKAGTHYIYYEFSDITLKVPFKIVEFGVRDVKAAFEEVFEYTEKTNGYIDTEFDENGEEYSYFRYYRPTLDFELIYDDGSCEVLSEHELFEKYGFEVFYDDGQSFETPWGCGTHRVSLFFMGEEFSYTVDIKESPVKNILVKDIDVYEYIDSYTETEEVYYPELDEYITESYDKYSYAPTEAVIEYKDGTSFKGEIREIEKKLEGESCLFDDQSYENQWDVGAHTATLYIAGYEAEFTVNVLPSPISEIGFEKAPDKTSFGIYETLDATGAVLRVEHTDGTYCDFELDDSFNAGEQSVYDDVIERDLAIVPGIYYDESDGAIYLSASIAVYDAFFPLEVYYQEATVLEAENRDGYLYITTDITGETCEMKVLDIEVSTLEDFSFENGCVGFLFSATVVTESGSYDGNIYLTYTPGNDLRCYENFKICLFGLESDSLESCPWFNARQYGETVMKLVGLADVMLYLPGDGFEGDVTSDNIDALTIIALTVGESYGLTSDLETLEYEEESGTYLISPEELEILIRRVFSVVSDEKIDFSSASFEDSYANGRYNISFDGEVSGVILKTPVECKAVKDGDGFKYEFTSTVSVITDTKSSVDVLIKIGKDFSVESFSVTRKAVSAELVTSDFKDTYYIGEALDTDGLKLSVRYNDGVEKLISVTPEMISGFDSSKAGECTVTVTYNGYSDDITVTVTEEEEYVKGDINGDGEVNTRDVLMARKAASGIIELNTLQASAADINADGEINTRDVLIIRKIAAGIF